MNPSDTYNNDNPSVPTDADPFIRARNLTALGVDRDAGVVRCAKCDALLDPDGKCWACAAPCDRCGTRAEIVNVYDSEGVMAEVCPSCAGEWIAAVVADFDAPVRVFTGRASPAEIKEHKRTLVERVEAEAAAAAKAEARRAAARQRSADQVDAVVAVVAAGAGPVPRRVVQEAVSFGINATETALTRAVREGRLNASSRGYTINNDVKEAA